MIGMFATAQCFTRFKVEKDNDSCSFVGSNLPRKLKLSFWEFADILAPCDHSWTSNRKDSMFP